MRKIMSFILILIALSTLGIGIKTIADGPLQDLTVDGTPIYYYGSGDRVQTPQNYVEKTTEFRGVWVATVINLNIPLHTSETQYKAAYDAILDKMEANHMNAIIFQVRPTNDAFYESDYAPFSRFLTGTEGTSPGWDVLEYLISEAHARGIEFHAWMNPYRVTRTGGDKTQLLNALHPDNFARQNPDLVIPDNNGWLILNPGEPEVVTYIENVVAEIMDLYDVDGIHFDDYFYPYDGLTSDTATYNTYKEAGETLADFRRENVNDVVRGVKEEVDAHNLAEGTDIRFGISPFGVWKVGGTDGADIGPASQSYSGQYADSKKWVEEGWVHYINPQIYWDFDHPVAPYADLVDWWVETVSGTDVDLIIGHGIYKTDVSVNEYYEQLKYNQKYPEIKGSVMYSANYLNTSQMNSIKNSAWTTTPINTWTTNDTNPEIFPDPIISIIGEGNDPYYQSAEITLTSDAPLMSYKINNGDWTTYTIPFNIDQEGVYQLSVRNEDELKNVITKEITIDQTIPNDPVITITGEKEGLYYIEETTVELSSSDENDSIYFRLHNGTSWSSWQEYDQAINLVFDGNFTLEYYAQDRALNTSEVLDERLRLSLPPIENNQFIIRDGEAVTYFQTDTAVELPTSYTEKTEEVRAVWVATVSNIDIGMHNSETSYKTEIINMLNILEALNFNVMFFQTRPMNDAFYESDYAPWSRYIMGAEGSDPGWDIFGFIIEEAHKRGIEVHAWLNPYRVATGTGSKASQLDALHDDNFAKQNPDLVIAGADGKLILNPGEARVRAYLTNVVNELMSKYDIDGIHFDDYFYLNNIDASEDQALYDRTKNTGETLADWRRRNVDMLIENLSNVIRNWNQNQDKNVKFGISPSGIWKSKYDYSGNIRPGGELGSHTSSTFESYNYAYADTRKWVMEGWLDYIMPQLYWQFDHSSAPFADLVKWWADLTEEAGVDLIVGLGFYRYTDNTWTDPNELIEQLRYMSQYDSIVGSSIFSYKTLNNFNTNVVSTIQRLRTTYWTTYPSFPWESDVVKTPDPIEQPTFNITGTIVEGYKYEDSLTINLSSNYDIYYKIDNGEWILYQNPVSINTLGSYEIFFKAVNDQSIESLVSSVEVEIINTTCATGYEYIDGACALIEVEEEVDPPKTGCFSAISTSSAIFITFALVLGTSIVVMVRKKEKVI
jgi:uncharacterized lipoprotein YddW (UPF0748 family)